MSLHLTESETRLLELLKVRSFRRVAAGELFTLTSGEKSDYFIDGKMTAVSSEGAELIGEVLYERTKDLGIDAIGALQVGAVPLVTAAVISYRRHARPIEGFWVREDAKAHRIASVVTRVSGLFARRTSAAKCLQAQATFSAPNRRGRAGSRPGGKRTGGAPRPAAGRSRAWGWPLWVRGRLAIDGTCGCVGRDGGISGSRQLVRLTS